MTENYSERLSQMKESWDKSEGEYDAMFGVVDAPKGEYNFQLVSAEIRQVGEYMVIAREQVILEGEYEKTRVPDLLFLGSEKNLAFVRRWIGKMDYEAPENPEELLDTIDAIAKEEPKFKGALTFYQDRPQVSVIELIDGGGTSTSSEPASSEPASTGADKTQEDTELLDNMFTFCATYSIDVDEKADFDTLKAAIATEEYDSVGKDALDEEEKQLLVDIGLEDNIKAPPKPAPAKKTAAKKKAVKRR